MKKIILLLVSLVTTLTSFSQNISGTVSDSLNSESLIGATIMYAPGKGTTTDVNGNFRLPIPVGQHNIEIRYFGYKTITKFITIKGDTVINFKMSTAEQLLKDVVVTAKIDKESVSELVKTQSTSGTVVDGANAETFKKTPDSKASDVFKRISGASVQDNKFVVIRGLNDRYNFGLINGAPLPSSESDRKAFSFDLFPSNMLDNITIVKSASPEYPGEFAGGIINISTTEPKEKNFQNLQLGLGYNTISTFQNFHTYNGSSIDFLGLGANFRQMPSGLPSTQEFSSLNKNEKADFAHLMSTTWVTNRVKALPAGTLQYSIGRNYKIGKKELDFVFAYNYQNTYNFNNQIRRDFEEQDVVVKKMELRDSVFTNNIMNSAMLNLTFQINDKNSLRFKNLYSINSEDKVNVRNGVRELDNDPRQWEKSTNFWYTQNNLFTSQLHGKHEIGKTKLHWNLNFSDVQRDIPNLRRVVYRKYSYLESDTTEQYVAVVQTNGTIPTSAGNMFWSTSNEKVYNLNYDYSIPISKNKIESDIKLGGWHQFRDRDFTSRNFGFSQYKPNGNTFNSQLLLLGPDEIFSQQNMGLLSNGQGGFKLEEATNVDDSYRASSLLNAGFIMGDVKYGSFRFTGGLRVESYNQKFNYIEFGSNLDKQIDTTVVDFLPSVNLIYSISKKMKIRTSYYRTVSRPEFRELAPFSFYNFVTDNIISGDPNLQRATIDNADLRWEFFPGKGQIITVSGFYKNFNNPIEMINRTGTSGAPELYYSNVKGATSVGSELEFRIILGTFCKKENKVLDNLTFYTNLSYISSTVNLEDFEGSGNRRPLQGQSPYIVNTGLFYNTPNKDFTASASYNFIGPRIYIVGNVQEPSVWENGRHVLDLQMTKKFGEKIEVKLNFRDLLAQKLVYFQDLNGNKVYDQKIDNTWQEIGFGQTITASFKYTF